MLMQEPEHGSRVLVAGQLRKAEVGECIKEMDCWRAVFHGD